MSSQISRSVPTRSRPRRFTISASAPVSSLSSVSASMMSVARMATASVAPSAPCRGTPTDSVTLRSASIATPPPVHPRSIIRASASSLAAAAGSNAGCEEYSTSLAGETRSRRVTSPARRRVLSAACAACEISPRSPPATASRSAWFSATIGARSRMRCTPVSTILLQSARLPVMAVRSSWSRSACSRWLPASTRPATITAMNTTTMTPIRALRPIRTYSTTCATRSRPSGG